MSEPEDLGFELPAPATTSRARVVIVAAAAVAVAFTIGYLQHRSSAGEMPAIATQPGAVHVEVITPNALTSDRALALPGVVRALEETKMYPRAAGYVRRWLVDIGDKVKEGQVLVEIDTPELDAQLAQARAQLAQQKAAVQQAIAQRDYARQTSTRYETLADQKLVSKAQVEQTQATTATNEATLAAAESAVAAAEANVRRLADLKSFATVVAPFAGTVTARMVDRGALVSGDFNMTPMFTVVATDPIRVFVDVPQTVAPSVRAGVDAAITVREYAGRTFAGKVTRAAGALDPDLHVMQTEIRVPNSDGALMPGMYVQVAITLPVPHRVLEIPASALYNDAQGLRVAVVDAQQKAHFAPITIERDTGATLWIATGLTGDERVIKIAVPALAEGDPVEVVAAAAR